MVVKKSLKKFEKETLEKQEGSAVATYFYRYIALKLLQVVVRTNITPNQITFFGSFCFLLASVSFLYNLNITGSILVFVWVIMDYLDGALARFKNQVSKRGLWYDHVGGIMLLILCIFSIMYRSYMNLQEYQILIFGFLSITAFWINYFIFTSFKEISSNPDGIYRRRKGLNFLRIFYFNPPNMIPLILLFSLLNRLDLFLAFSGLYGWLFAIVGFVKLTRDLSKEEQNLKKQGRS